MTGLLLPKPIAPLKGERSRVRQVSRRDGRQLELRADQLCAELVKQRAGNKCEAEGVHDIACSRTLDWAHGVSRRFASVRYSHANAWCLCREHHAFFTTRPLAWEGWQLSKLGPVAYLDVAARARAVRRADLAEIIAGLRSGVFVQGERA